MDVQDLADYIVNTSCEETTTGNYHISFADLMERFPALREDWIKQNTEDLIHAILRHMDKVIEVERDVENGDICGFDLVLWLDACPNYEEEKEF